jgi:hypothetical protein
MAENNYDFEDQDGSYIGSGKKGKKDKETTGGERRALAAIVALVAAIILFAVLTIIQRNIVNAGEKVSVVVAVKDVPAGLNLTQESIQQYFTVQLRLKNEVPAGTFSSGHPLVGQITAKPLFANAILTTNDLINENPYEGVDDPVELSIDVSKLSHAVSGTLRAGDRVDIKIVVDMSYLQQDKFLDGAGDYSLSGVPNLVDDSVKGENKDGYSYDGSDALDTLSWRELSSFDADSYSWSATGKFACVPVATNVRVIDVYTAAGEGTAQIESTGVPQVATVFTVVVPRSMEDLLWLALEEGTMEISKIVSEEDLAAASERVNPVTETTAEGTAN